MDDQTFQKELAKYKIVRRADHYKPRNTIKKNDMKKDASRILSSGSQKNNDTVVSIPNNADFWEIVSAANKSGLTPTEFSRFLTAMKEGYPSILETLNLDDLEALACSIAPSAGQ